MCEECAPSVPFSRLIGCSGFGDPFGRVDKNASDNIQEVISMVSGLMCNEAAFCWWEDGFEYFCEEFI